MKRQISLILAAVIILSAVCVVFSSCKSKEASFYDSVVCETEDFKGAYTYANDKVQLLEQLLKEV